ncbi:uncharacterized protein BP5553_09426 [Venustampulla echinocandica]|uniref:C2H2-type domain-containing protein n=1 Tax=Venustampulla echinocandica TaxID=2656787 RepID=A0A370TCS4_9HELO|nr:uncharacterized protein BP5553_09426 [Venustampulla echinocandica]RDL32024.1 hypothetical protein BP5553_09426 [Venustampulla echinocandica]
MPPTIQADYFVLLASLFVFPIIFYVAPCRRPGQPPALFANSEKRRAPAPYYPTKYPEADGAARFSPLLLTLPLEIPRLHLHVGSTNSRVLAILCLLLSRHVAVAQSFVSPSFSPVLTSRSSFYSTQVFSNTSSIISYRPPVKMPPRLSNTLGEPDEEPTFCDKCNLKFKTWMAYHAHKISHPDHRDFTCAICSRDFASEKACERHYGLSHPAKQQLSCPGCQTVFTRLGGLISHIESKQCSSLVVPDFKERLEERKVFYDNHAEVRTHLGTSITTGNLGDHTALPIFSKQRPFAIEESKGGNEKYVAQAGSSQASFELLSLETSLKADVPLSANDDLMSFDDASRILNAPWDSSDPENPPGILFENSGPPSAKQATSDFNIHFPPLGGYETTIVETAATSQGGNVRGIKESHSNAPQPMPASIADAKENTPWIVNADMSSDPSNDDRTWSYNPSNPEFNVDKFWIRSINKFKCPHKGCPKSFVKKGQFTQHVSTHANPKENLQCRHCLRWFASATALTQHSESQAVRCNIRERNDFNARVDEFTAGTAAPVGRHEDNTIRYAVNNLRPDASGAANIVAAHKAALQASDEDTAEYWEKQRPEW